MPRIISYASFSKTTQHTINYLQYIDRQSPLFSPGGEADVKEAVRQARRDTGNLAWYQILSFPSEELERLQADRNYFKAFLTTHKLEIAKAYNITPGALHCYASFHDKDYHPHLHLVFWSSVPGEGAVRVPKQASEVETKKLRAKALNEKSNVIKSLFANEMFRGDIEQLRVQKGEIRQAMNQQLEQQLQALANGKSTLPVGLVDELQKLGQEISVLPGKAQYGWLPSEIKGRVSDLLRQAVLQTPELAELYAQSREAYYNIVKDTYVDSKITMAEKMEQWEQQFFAPMKGQDARKQNLLIETACKLSSKEKMPEPAVEELPEPPVEELPEPPAEELPEPPAEELPEPPADNSLPASSKEKMPEKVPPLPVGVVFHAEWSPQYKQARAFLYGDDVTPRNFSAAYSLLQQEAESGSALAMNDLGRMNADGLGREIDPQAADAWYQRALVAFLAAEKAKPRPYLQYRIGKLYAAGLGTPQDYATAAKWFGEAVEKDHRYAQYSLGGLYYRGQGVIQDYKQAFILYSSSADQGNPYAAYELAKMYRDGIGTPVNEVKANQYFKAAFRGFDSLEKEGHDDKLQYRIGQMLYTGTGTVKNIPLAVEYLQKSAQMGNVNAQYLLGKICLEKGIGDPTQAIEWIMKAAKAENAGAQYALAKVYQDGKYLPKDTLKAVELFTASANQKNDFAEYQLGKLYLLGEEVPKDIKTALHWLNRSVEKNNQFAQYALGKLYLAGKEVPKDVNEALRLLLLSANQGNDFAAYQLGKMYLLGVDVPRDSNAAFHWLSLSAEKNNQFAEYKLGVLYLRGELVTKDAPRALQFLEASAKQGNPVAQYALGKLLLKGDRGVPRDREQGMYWMQKSAQQGNAFAAAYLQYQSKSALSTTCSMLYQLGKIIEADQRAQQNYTGLRHGRMKRKRRGHEYEQQPGIER